MLHVLPQIYHPKLENTINCNALPPQILRFQYIAPLILRASTEPDLDKIKYRILVIKGRSDDYKT